MKDVHGSQDWRALCELASQEQDPEKLLDLISKINQALEEWNRQSRMDRSPIKIKNVMLPANMLEEQKEEQRLELPGVYLPLVSPSEYDC